MSANLQVKSMSYILETFLGNKDKFERLGIKPDPTDNRMVIVAFFSKGSNVTMRVRVKVFADLGTIDDFIPIYKDSRLDGTTFPRLSKSFGGLNEVELPDELVEGYVERIKHKRPPKDARNRHTKTGKRKGKLSQFSNFEIERQLKSAKLALELMVASLD